MAGLRFDHAPSNILAPPPCLVLSRSRSVLGWNSSFNRQKRQEKFFAAAQILSEALRSIQCKGHHRAPIKP
ncbi:Serine/threonine-protein kinase Nek8 [Clarias magur]|uniref:Serine/threonine-protein kinase Nek8 n=1 Tax=Clarias magur TaxID=1594786 RepID=A0A8J4U5R5_CLAMG|nr:Serine/threonine-protein kinase Nek8 [Clarias magur]